jgi:two-component system, chemotaxis family, CheB/CheR fusion protein
VLISNEEAQAANEELETLNEELQATIEELNTANADLIRRGADLQQLTDTLAAQHRQSEGERAQLAAILANMADAVLVVMPDGMPLLTNAASQQLFSSSDVRIQDDQGHPLLREAAPQARAAR